MTGPVRFECPNYESPLCGLSNVRDQLGWGAFVEKGQYYNVGAFQNGLARTDVIADLPALPGQEQSIWEHANVGCIACGKCLIVTRDVNGHSVERHADLDFRFK